MDEQPNIPRTTTDDRKTPAEGLDVAAATAIWRKLGEIDRDSRERDQTLALQLVGHAEEVKERTAKFYTTQWMPMLEGQAATNREVRRLSSVVWFGVGLSTGGMVLALVSIVVHVLT